MAPIRVTHVGRRRREPGLKGERIPDGNSVAGEADLIAMIAEPAPTVEEKRPLAFTLLISEVHIVEPPRWVDAGQLRGWLLLPIEPPEIDALLLQRMVQKVHVIGRVFFCR